VIEHARLPPHAMPCLCGEGVACNIPAAVMGGVRSPVRLFENITAVSTHSSTTDRPALILDSHALPTPASRDSHVPPLLPPYFPLHCLPTRTHSPRARLVLGDLTLTEQLPTSRSPLLSRPQHPPTNTLHPAPSLQVTSLFAHPHANTTSSLHASSRPRALALSSFTAST
jgi:hypothetical protein